MTKQSQLWGEELFTKFIFVGCVVFSVLAWLGGRWVKELVVGSVQKEDGHKDKTVLILKLQDKYEVTGMGRVCAFV